MPAPLMPAAPIDASLVCSVVIAARNAARVLPECLAALGRQTMAASLYEVIVVDDGSTDATAILAQGQGVRCFSQDHAGPAAARNLGACVARGPVIVFTDADCRPDRDWLEAMVTALRAGSTAGVVGVQGRYVTDQTSLVARFAQAEFENRYERMAAWSSIDLVATYSAAYLREVFLAAGGFDTRFPRADNEDTELSYRLVAAGHTLTLAPKARVCHRHPATLGRYLRVKAGRGYWRTQVYRLYPDKAVRDRYTTLPVKLGTLAAMGWIAGSLAGVVLWPVGGNWLWAVSQMCPVVMAALSWTLARQAWSKDRAVGIVTPAMVVLRGLALACGVFWGLIRPAAGLGRGQTSQTGGQ